MSNVQQSDQKRHKLHQVAERVGDFLPFSAAVFAISTGKTPLIRMFTFYSNVEKGVYHSMRRKTIVKFVNNSVSKKENLAQV